MAEVVVQGTLKADGTLELNQPVNLPPGEVRIIVQAMAPRSGESLLAVLAEIRTERRVSGMQGRTAQQIDNDVQAMRHEWEERQRDIEALRFVKE